MYNLVAAYNNKYYYICSTVDEAPLHTIKNIYKVTHTKAIYSIDDRLSLREINLKYKNCYEFIRDYKASNHLHEVIQNG